MKQKFIKKAVTVMTFMLLSTAFCNAVGGTNVTRFSDVPDDYWGYQTIMEMTKSGIFKGTTDPVDGVGTFSPEKEMTRAEFITASLRAAYPEEAAKIGNDRTVWWKKYYQFALEKGILTRRELNDGQLDKPMTREEMAMVMVRCVAKKGEHLQQRIQLSQIPDYSQIGEYYTEYVLDCFSFGLLCGVDKNGSFAPTKSLTRAEAATVLCRLVDEKMRVEVEFIDEPNKDGNSDENAGYNSGSNNQSDFDFDYIFPIFPGTNIPQTPEQEETILLPWENGGKQPSEYTWAEFEALPDSQKSAFIETFGGTDDFEKWMNKAQGTQGDEGSEELLPWENGGKQPSEYTWAEFEALPDSQKNAFIESFGSTSAFDNWMNSAQGILGNEGLPWENGGKQPSEYTLAEFEALPNSQKGAFVDSFGSPEAFENWLAANQQ